MNTRKLIIGVGSVTLLAALGWLLFGFFGIQALFFDRTVDEPVPASILSSEPTLPDIQQEDAASAAPIVDGPWPEKTDGSGPVRLLASGDFMQGDSTYSIRGTATITEEEGIQTLSLTDFDVTNGPDLFVYLVSASTTNNAAVKEIVRDGKFVNLGALKGNRGNQAYVFPPEIKIEKDAVISIWCRRFSRNFGAAKLETVPIDP